MKKLQPTSKKSLAIWAGAVFIVAYIAVEMVIVTGGTPVIIHPINALVFVATAILLVIFGNAVRKLKAREHTWMTYAQAGYVVIFSQACLYFSAIMIGFMSSQVLVGLLRHDSSSMLWLAIGAGLCLLGAIILAAAGFIVESWCIVDDDDKDDFSGSAKGSGAANPV